jgi:CheY-like chemotaxis protein
MKEPALVLVVDDYAESREICSEYLQFLGYRVACAADGLEAIEKAYELGPDLILMDLSLPKLDGWEATRRLRADARTQHIPIVALSAHVLESERHRAMEAGCATMITKPVLPRDLAAEVRKQLAATHPEESE